ncbi:hypothetical protein GF366_03405, partial [Candidatus Peregrinibacteria bacterium]|nr:hypothetical protein [Candidatus Peregrinibacteria bacterium]
MRAIKFLYFQNFKESRLIFKNGVEAAPPVTPEAKLEDERKQVQTKEIKQRKDARVETSLTSPDKKSDILSSLDREKFDNILERNKIEGTTIELSSLDGFEVSRLIKFCNENPENFPKILKKIKEAEIKGIQLNQSSLEILLGYYEINEEAVKTIVNSIINENNSYVTAFLIKATEVMEEKKTIRKKIFKKIKNNESVYKQLDTTALTLLIESVGYKTIIKNTSFEQKSSLIGTEKIDTKNKKEILKNLLNNKEIKQPENAVHLAESLYKLEENKKLYEEFLKFLDKGPFYLKKEIAENERLNPEIRKDAYELAKDRQDEVEDPEAPEIPEKSEEEKTAIDNAGIEITDTRVQFPIEGVERSFIKTPAFVSKLQRLKNPEAVKLACYERLLKIITRDHSIDENHKDYNKHEIATDEAFEKSNNKLISEIARLRKTVEKAPAEPAVTKKEEKIGEAPEGAVPPEERAEAAPPPTERPQKPAPEAAPPPAERPQEPAFEIQPTTRPESTEEERKADQSHEYLEKTLMTRIKEIYPDKEIKIKENYLEITMTTEPPEFPKFYLEPQLNEEGKMENLVLTYKRYFIGDVLRKTPDNLTNEGIKSFLEYEKEEALEDIRDHKEFIGNLKETDIKAPEGKGEVAEFLLKWPFKIPDIKKDFTAGEDVMDLKDDENKWFAGFDRLEGHNIYYTTFEEQFGMATNEVPERMMRIIGITSSVNFNDILREVAKDYAPGYDTDNVDDFESKFNVDDFESKFKELLVLSRSNNPEAIKNRPITLYELRRMYDLYLGGMKVLKTLEIDRVKTIERESFEQKYSLQIETVESTDEKCAFNKYYSVKDITKEKITSEKGNFRIGVSQKAFEEFLKVAHSYLKDTVDPDFSLDTVRKKFEGGAWETGDILRTIFRAYQFDELVSVRKIVKKESTEKGITKMLLTDIPENFKADSSSVKLLFERFKDDSLGDEKLWGDLDAPTKEESHKMRLAEVQSELSVSEESYKQKVLKLLKTHRTTRTTEADTLEWAFSKAVDLETDMTLRNIGYYYDVEGLEIRRYSSPEAIVDNLFGKQNVEIRNKEGEKENLRLYNFENGVKIINEKAVKRYIDLLIYKGLKRRRRKEIHRERIYKYDEIIDREIEISEHDTLDSFVKRGGKENAWKAIPGHKPIEDTLTKEPFKISRKEVPTTMYNLLKDRDTISMETIVNKLLKKDLGNFDKVNDDYEDIIDKKEELREELEDIEEEISEEAQPSEGKIKKLRKIQNNAAEIDVKYHNLKVYIDGAAILLQRLEKAGTHVSIDYSFERLTKTNLLDQDIPELANEQIDLLNEGYIAERERGYSKQMLERENIDIETLDLSGSYLIREIQLKALKKGYPPSRVKEIENKLLIAAGVGIEGKSISGGGVGFVVPIEEGFAVEFGVTH